MASTGPNHTVSHSITNHTVSLMKDFFAMEAYIFTCHLSQTLLRFNAYVKLKGGHVHANMTIPFYDAHGEIQGRDFAVVYSAEDKLYIPEKTVGSPEVNLQAEHGATFLSKLVIPDKQTIDWIKREAHDLGHNVLPPGFELPA